MTRIMIDQSLTAEEKLLQLIRKKGASSTEKKDKSGLKTKPVKRAIDPSGALLVVWLSRLGWAACLAAAIYLGQIYFSRKPLTESTVLITSQPAQQDLTQNNTAELPSLKPSGYYESVLAQRDIFLAPWEIKSQEIITQPVADVRNSFKLVGIVMDKEPSAIIEDLQTGETLFLSEGGMMREAVVKQITAEKVVIEYQGNSFDMVP